MKVKRNQTWVNKQTGKEVKILRKSTGFGHWTVSNGHHVHEGTLNKFYELTETAIKKEMI